MDVAGIPNRVEQRARLIDGVGIERPLKVRVIQSIEKLGAELRVHSLGNSCVLVEREVEILVAWTGEDIAPRIAQKIGACWKRRRKRVAIVVVKGLRRGSRH